MRKTALTVALLATLAAAGCSSSSSSHPATSASPAVTATHTSLSGTETITGTVTGKAAEANNPTFPLTFRGPIATTGTFTPPNNNDVHQVVTFKTAAGNMVVNATVPGNSNPNGPPPTHLPGGNGCVFGFTMHASYTINGAQSTGKWAGASGSGNVIVNFSAELPKLSNGQCNLSQNVQPVSGTSKAVFTAAGPLTVKA
jgi:hypothetical protein